MTGTIEQHEASVRGYDVSCGLDQDGDDIVSWAFIENPDTGASASLGWAEGEGELTDGRDGDEDISDRTVQRIREWVESKIEY